MRWNLKPTGSGTGILPVVFQNGASARAQDTGRFGFHKQLDGQDARPTTNEI